MKKWWLKAVLQKFISFLPFKHKINFLFQKHITKGVFLSDELFNNKLVHCYDHVSYCEIDKKDSNCLELGTGWFPVIPIALFLSGASKVSTIDISSLVDTNRFQETINKFKTWLNDGKIEFYLPYIVEERKKDFLNTDFTTYSLPELLVYFKMDLIIGDARSLASKSNSIDYIISNNVFEHIHESTLDSILAEFHRILKPKGVMSHFVDMSDHFAHMDSTITIYNYLQFSKIKWKMIDNSIQPQNRMRLNQYEELIYKRNFQIKSCISRVSKINLKEIGKLAIHPDFKSMPLKSIAVSHVHFSLQKNPA